MSPDELLREATGGYLRLIDALPAVPRLLLLDPVTTIYVGPQVESLTGYSRERMMDEPALWWDVIHDEDRERMLAVLAEHSAEGTAISEEYRVSAHDDRVVWIREESRVLVDGSGRPIASQGILLDVTEPKRMERELKSNVELRRAFAARLVKAEEDERVRVAAEIYAGPIQVLSELKLSLEAFTRGIADREKSTELADIAATMDRAVHRLGLIVSELGPPLSDASGLISVIRFLLRDLAEFAGLISHLDERIGEELSPETCTVVYRIVNACLKNIREHAHARNVVVALESSENGILVTIEDNGRGFDIAGMDRDPAEHIGLQLMRERAEAACGWYHVESAPGRGTTTEFWIPSSPVADGGEPAPRT